MLPGGHDLWRDTDCSTQYTYTAQITQAQRKGQTHTHTPRRMGAGDPEGGEPLNVRASLSSSVAQHKVSHTPVWVLLFILVLLFVWLG